MAARFKGLIRLILILIILLPRVSIAADGTVPGAVVKTEKKLPGQTEIEPSRPVSSEQNLASLVGAEEISVSVDPDGHFSRYVADYRLEEEEKTEKVGDVNLQRSINAGRSFNRESRTARARTRQAEAQAGQALALLLPSISLRANRGYERSEPSVVVDEETGNLLPESSQIRTDVVFTASQPLFDLSSFLDWRRRKVKVRSRQQSYRISDGDAFETTVRAYLSLLSSRLQTSITIDFEEQLSELLDYIEKRANAGASSVSDMSRVKARRQATHSARLEQEATHAAAGIEFVKLTNIVPQKLRLPRADDVGADLLPVSLDEAVRSAMTYNPEIAVLTEELRVAEIDRSVAKGQFLPRVDLEYTDTYSLHAGGSTDSDGQRDRRLMFVLNWNLFSGGKDYKTTVERSARFEELRYRLDGERRQVIQQLSSGYSTLATTRKRIDAGYKELDSIKTAAEAMTKRMLSGNQSLLDLLDVLSQFFQARANLVHLHILEMNTVTHLVRLTYGTPWGLSNGTVALNGAE